MKVLRTPLTSHSAAQRVCQGMQRVCRALWLARRALQKALRALAQPLRLLLRVCPVAWRACQCQQGQGRLLARAAAAPSAARAL